MGQYHVCWYPRGRLNIKMSSYQYSFRDPHIKDKTILSLTWESSYLGKSVFILKRGPGSCLIQAGSCLPRAWYTITFKVLNSMNIFISFLSNLACKELRQSITRYQWVKMRPSIHWSYDIPQFSSHVIPHPAEAGSFKSQNLRQGSVLPGWGLHPCASIPHSWPWRRTRPTIPVNSAPSAVYT